jgi:hypothetical protein
MKVTATTLEGMFLKKVLFPSNHAFAPQQNFQILKEYVAFDEAIPG